MSVTLLDLDSEEIFNTAISNKSAQLTLVSSYVHVVVTTGEEVITPGLVIEGISVQRGATYRLTISGTSNISIGFVTVWAGVAGTNKTLAKSSVELAADGTAITFVPTSGYISIGALVSDARLNDYFDISNITLEKISDADYSYKIGNSVTLDSLQSVIGTKNLNALCVNNLTVSDTLHVSGSFTYDSIKLSEFNTTLGQDTLHSDIGARNIAIGNNALYYNTGTDNIAVGYNSLYNNTNGWSNTAIGTNALYTNTAGLGNVAIGYNALHDNTNGTFNIGIGYEAGEKNTSGSSNIALGYGSLTKNTTGSANISIGQGSLNNCTTGIYNTSIGFYSSQVLTTGQNNICIGGSAGPILDTGSLNIAIGYGALQSTTTQSNNIGIGNLTALTNRENCVAIGNNAGALAESDYFIVLGTSSHHVITQNAIVTVSDKREKKNIINTRFGSEFIKALHPVDYEWNNNIDETIHHGFIAQDVKNLEDRFGKFGGVHGNNDEGRMSLAYAEFTAPIIKTLQEILVRIEKIEQTLDGGPHNP